MSFREVSRTFMEIEGIHLSVPMNFGGNSWFDSSGMLPQTKHPTHPAALTQSISHTMLCHTEPTFHLAFLPLRNKFSIIALKSMTMKEVSQELWTGSTSSMKEQPWSTQNLFPFLHDKLQVCESLLASCKSASQSSQVASLQACKLRVTPGG